MGVPKQQLLILLFLIMLVSSYQKPRVAEARGLSLMPQQAGSSSFFSTLGLVCKCCDGDKGECTSTWTKSCSKLQCFPWKLDKVL